MILLLFLSLPLIAGDMPFVFTGTSIGAAVSSNIDEKITLDVYGEGELSIGTRGIIGEDGSFSFLSRLSAAIYDDLVLKDQEYINLQLDFSDNRIEASLLASLVDDGMGSTYINPGWKASGEIAAFTRNRGISLEYSGYVAYLPKSLDDVFYQGLNVVYRADQSIFLGYGLAIGGGWEYRYEQAANRQEDGSGFADRQDVILDFVGTIDGFAGYFTDWAVTGGISLRKSNAALVIGSGSFLEGSEDRLSAVIKASVFTSPHQAWTLEGMISADGDRYLSRPARDAAGIYGDANLMLLDMGVSGRVEWSPDQATYLSFDAEFGYNLSNDPFLVGWYTKGVLTLTI